MKKLLAMSLALAMVLSLAACGGDGGTGSGSKTPSNPGSSQTNTPAGGDVELTYLTWDATVDANGNYKLQNAIDAYTKENPNVKIKLEIVAENDSQAFLEQLDRFNLTGDTAEIIALPSARTYNLRAEQGFFLPLNSYLDAEGVTYSELYSSNLAVDGTYYAIPQCGAQIYGVFINKDMLDEAGLAVPKMGWTWDDYADYAAKMTKGEGASKVYGSHLHFTWAEFLREGLFNTVMDNPYVKADGSSNLDSPYFAEWLTYIKKLQDDGYNMSYADISNDGVGYRDVFFQGRCAMLPIGEWILTNIADKNEYPHDFEVVFAPFPVFSDGTPGVTQKGGSNCHAIGANTDPAKAQAAYDFIRWFSNEGAVICDQIPADRSADVEGAQRDRLAAMGLAEAGFDVDSYLSIYLSKDLVTNEIASYADLFDQIDSIYVAEVQMYLTGAQDLDTTLANFRSQASALF